MPSPKTTDPQTKADTRTLEREIQIAAPIEKVWAALTEAEHLKNWFPLDARVTPGAGGSIWMAWAGEFEGTDTIEIWEPPHHLRATFNAGPGLTAVDYHLESKGGSTILRLVHTGFGRGADWDSAYDGVRHGWRSELHSLRLYLERHHGRTRRAAWLMLPADSDDADIWRRLIGPRGFNIRGDLAPGDRFTAFPGEPDEFSGRVLLSHDDKLLCCVVDTMDDAYFRIEIIECAGPRSVWIWLASWNADEPTLRARESRLRDRIGGALKA